MLLYLQRTRIHYSLYRVTVTFTQAFVQQHWVLKLVGRHYIPAKPRWVNRLRSAFGLGTNFCTL